MNVPAVHLGGWFDTFCQGTIDEFVGRQHQGAEGGKGHRIRVTVTSSNFPRFDVNPGTGKPWTTAEASVKQTNRIGCGGDKASRVVLPVVLQGKGGK